MSHKWEIKTLNQIVHTDAAKQAPKDEELAALLSDGWETIPELCGVTTVYSDGNVIDSRIVTLRRQLPSAFDVLFKANYALVEAIEKDHPFLPGQSPHDDILAYGAYAWRKHGDHHALLKTTELYQSDLTPEMLKAFETAQSAFAAYEASKKGNN